MAPLIFVSAGLPVIQLAIVALITFLSIVLTRSYAAAFRTAERLAVELRDADKSTERFVPAAFFESLGRKHRTAVGLGEFVEMDMVVLFADIRSFTGIADELGPAGTFSLLNDWLARIGPIIRARDGFVDKYLGDGILALFPPDKADVVACAVARQVETYRISADRIESGFSPFLAGLVRRSTGLACLPAARCGGAGIFTCLSIYSAAKLNLLRDQPGVRDETSTINFLSGFGRHEPGLWPGFVGLVLPSGRTGAGRPGRYPSF
ncbi:MAG: hypothetical protein A2Y32_12750 [Spirochaetes bacterium GWF1_60_12]|nr:MAG: hypothetical protein A2Y32_12750 [Spirochaetes bacterium GWF1_60_12]